MEVSEATMSRNILRKLGARANEALLEAMEDRVNKSAGFRLLGSVPFWVEFLWYVKCPALLQIPLPVVYFPVAG
jgi:hypothetical protein